jgi:plastocyanin
MSESPPRGFLLAIGVVGIVIGLLIVAYLAIPLQPPLTQNPIVTTTQQTTQQQGVVYVDMPPGVGSSLKLDFQPANITVVIGVNATVIWRNLDTVIHTVTAVDKSFDSGDMKEGATFSYTFTKPGVYDYYCIYHAWMRGTVIVKSKT